VSVARGSPPAIPGDEENGVDSDELAATLYDLNPTFPDDLPFYRARIPTPDAHVLEAGCGTGRVLLELLDSCGFAYGIDISTAKLAVCSRKIQARGIAGARVAVAEADVTDFHLDREFHLIIAPYRVLQCLETDAEVSGFFKSVRSHLAPGGTCVISAFNPRYPPSELRRWCRDAETLQWETSFEGRRVTCHDRRPRMDPTRLVLYPELVYRVYDGDRLLEEMVEPIVMRCFYPDDLEHLARTGGFRVMNRWGGYDGEEYGQGPELVLEIAPSEARHKPSP